jgi:hypothetical protein
MKMNTAHSVCDGALTDCNTHDCNIHVHARTHGQASTLFWMLGPLSELSSSESELVFTSLDGLPLAGERDRARGGQTVVLVARTDRRSPVFENCVCALLAREGEKDETKRQRDRERMEGGKKGRRCKQIYSTYSSHRKHQIPSRSCQDFRHPSWIPMRSCTPQSSRARPLMPASSRQS